MIVYTKSIEEVIVTDKCESVYGCNEFNCNQHVHEPYLDVRLVTQNFAS